MGRHFLVFFLFCAIVLFAQEDLDDFVEDDDYVEEDPLSVGGGTQQTCDACRTVMDQLLKEWHTIDNDSFLEAIDEASHINEYVPVIPEDDKEREAFERKVVKRYAQSMYHEYRFMKRCKNVDIWIQYKPHIRKTCEEVVKTSGKDIAHILVDKNKEVDTDIMNYLTRVVCMGLNQLCTIKYLNLDARSVNSKCENCVNIARLLEFQTRRASRKYIQRGFFFDNLLESVCETIPFYYSQPSAIGTLCEELVSEYDGSIVRILQKVADEGSHTVEEELCVKAAHICSKKEFKRIQNYDYRNAMYDFQSQQNIRSMSMDDMDEEI